MSTLHVLLSDRCVRDAERSRRTAPVPQEELLEPSDCEARCRDHSDCQFFWSGAQHGAATCRLFQAGTRIERKRRRGTEGGSWQDGDAFEGEDPWQIFRWEVKDEKEDRSLSFWFLDSFDIVWRFWVLCLHPPCSTGIPKLTRKDTLTDWAPHRTWRQMAGSNISLEGVGLLMSLLGR